MIIVFEGLDGAGKSTSIQPYSLELQKLGYEVLVGYEPGGTYGANAIRHTLKSVELTKSAQALMFMAARVENHADGAIYKYLKERENKPNLVLILDRYDASTYIYQGLIHRPHLAAVYEKVANAMEFIEPDLYVFFDVSFEESKRRRSTGMRKADISMEADVLERELESKTNFDEMRTDYRNFLVSKQRGSQVPFVEIDTTELGESEKIKVLTEKLNDYLIPITECVGQ